MNLEGINFYGDRTLEDIISHNIISYVKYGLLEIGGFFNITVGKTDYRGRDMSRLNPISGTGIAPNTIYRGIKQDWVWEQNINLKYASGSQPLQVTGVVVNGTGYPLGSTIFGSGFYVDYPRGQVVFGNPLPSSAIVQAPYTVRAAQVYDGDSTETREFVYNWQQIADPGTITELSEKGFLPGIFVTIPTMRTRRGIELGNRGKYTDVTLEFNIFAGNSHEVKKLMDVLYMLETKGIYFYNLATAPKPLNYRGEIINSSYTWPYLINNYRLSFGRFREDAVLIKIKNKLPVFNGKVRITLEIETFPI